MCVFGCLKRVMVRLSSICKPPISSFWARKCNEVLRDECHQRLQNFTVLSSSIFEWPSSSGSASYGSFYDFIRFLASPPISNQMNTFEIFIQRLAYDTQPHEISPNTFPCQRRPINEKLWIRLPHFPRVIANQGVLLKTLLWLPDGVSQSRKSSQILI